MDNNKDVPWYLKGTLKDWAIIVSLIGFFYLNFMGSSAKTSELSLKMETIQNDVSDVKTTVKETARENKVFLRDIELRQNKLELEFQLLKKDVEARSR